MPSGVVEYILDATSVIAADAGFGGDPAYAPAKVYDGDLDTAYASAGAPGWAGIDAGAGNTVVVTDVWFSPRNDGGEEVRTYLAALDSSPDKSAWTNVGQIDFWPFLRAFNHKAFTAATARRYWRLVANPLAADRHFDVAELRFGGPYASATGSPRWRPARPAISPGAGRYAAGQSVAITCPTTDASIYYTTDGTAPDNTKTLYAGAFTLPTIASGATYTVKAVAYHASGTSVYSDVVSAPFTAAEYTPGSTGSPPAWYDDRGIALEMHAASVKYDDATGKYWGVGMKTTSTDGTADQDFQLYSSTDLYNWHWEATVPLPPSGWSGTGSTPQPERPHWLVNPSPADPNKAYVLWCHFNTGGQYCGCATAPALGGTWTWRGTGPQQPNGYATRDCTLFADPQSNDKWFVSDCTDGSSNRLVQLARLDPATDLTTFDGTYVPLGSAGEAPALFYQGGYYFLITSASSPYGVGATSVTVRSATTLAGLAVAAQPSLWNFTPGGTSVAYNFQPSGITRAHGRRGYVLWGDWWDVGGSPVNLNRARIVAYPVPDTAFAAGALSIPAPSAWSLSDLPAEATVRLSSVRGLRRLRSAA